MIDMTPTIEAKSDQLNADDLVGGPITITITKISKGAADQPINLYYDGDKGKPFKPCKTIRRILVSAWGKDGNAYVGKSMTIYNDPEVKWAGKPVGGIRVSHLSDIESDIDISLAITRGVKRPFHIKRLNIQKQQTVQPKHNPDTGEITQLKIRLIKSDGTDIDFQDFEAWLEFIRVNLDKMETIERIETFTINHKAVFDEYRAAGWGGWSDKALGIINANRDRLKGGDNGGL